MSDTNNKLVDPIIFEGCVYYSQNREDLILSSFFPDVEKGFYVDVGAFDPNIDSVTKLFYLRGWKGINIEPQPERYRRFLSKRKRDINLNLGIATKRGTLSLRAYPSGGLSTFSESVKSEYERTPGDDTREYADYSVEVYPLREIFNLHAKTPIHFLKVDVEGLEYEVLDSNDWNKYRPEVLCIEANHVLHDWHPLLHSSDYELVFSDGLNEYFADRRTDRSAKFNYVQDVVTARGGGARADIYEAMMAWKHEAGKQRIRAEYAEHHKEELAAELASAKAILGSIKHTTSHLGALLKQKTRKRKAGQF